MTISDINAEARALCDADTNSYQAADLLRRVNSAYEEIVGMLINADGTWQFDDTNYTDIPVGKITLVDGQQSYTFNDKLLDVEEVAILNDGDVFQKLIPIDHSEIPAGLTLQEYFGGTETTPKTGFPQYYDKVSDDTIKIYPAPAANEGVTLASGLRVRFKRTAKVYTSAEVTTGTKVPGFVVTHHSILAYMAAIPYCMTYKKDRVPSYQQKVLEMKEELIKIYSRREKDKRKVLRSKRIKFR